MTTLVPFILESNPWGRVDACYIYKCSNNNDFFLLLSLVSYLFLKKAFRYTLENKQKDNGTADAILLCVRWTLLLLLRNNRRKCCRQWVPRGTFVGRREGQYGWQRLHVMMLVIISFCTENLLDFPMWLCFIHVCAHGW